MLRRCQSKCALVRIPPEQMAFPWPDSQALPLDIQRCRVPCSPGDHQGYVIRKPETGDFGGSGSVVCIITREFPRTETVRTIDLRLTHWTASRLPVTLGRSSSPSSWAAAKASSRESPWNLLLMFMQWPVWSCIQYGYCSASRGCQLVAGVKICPGFGQRILSAYHCIRFWKNVWTVPAGRRWGWNRLGQTLRWESRWTPQESHVAQDYFLEGHSFQLFKNVFFNLHRVNEVLFLVYTSMSFGKCMELCNHHSKAIEQFCHLQILLCRSF